MSRARIAISGAALAVILTGWLVLASPAQADTFCVPPATGCQHSEPTIAAALTAAKNNPTPNTITLGAGTYSENGLTYSGSEPLTIEGAGQTATTIAPTSASPTALTLNTTAAVYITGLRIHLPDASSDFGVDETGSGGGTVSDVTIDADPGATDPSGVSASGTSTWTVSGSTIDLPAGGDCIYADADETQITDDTLSGCAMAINAQAGTFDAARLTISNVQFGVDIGGGGGRLDDSLLTGISSTGVQLGIGTGTSATMTVNQDTIVGSSGSAGVECYNGIGVAGNVTVTDSIISGFSFNLYRYAASGSCSITDTYNDYSGFNYTVNSSPGTGSITTTHLQTGSPGFIDASAGNYRLSATSPLLKLDSTALVVGESSTDLDGGVRIISGKRDLGAYERPLAATATNSPVSAITQTSAGIAGTLNTGGTSGGWQVDYGPTTSYGSHTTLTTLTASTTDQPVTTTLTSLQPGLTYHYQLVLTTPYGTSTSPDQTFMTLPLVPAVVTGTPTSVTQTSATLAGTVNSQGVTPSDCHFDYGTTTAYGSSAPCAQSPGSGSSPVAVSASISGLAPGTTYHFRLVAANASGSTTGSDQSFTTPSVPTPSATVSITGSLHFTAGAVHAPLGCGAGGATCSGSVAIDYRVRLAATKKTKAHTVTRVLGSASYTLSAGKGSTIKVRLSSAGKALLARKGKLKVTVVVTLAQPDGSAKTAVTRTLTL
ncbi:MAG: hypothetical protein ABSG64_00060 [Solirubrobacteraceae bacterium]|jgi:hypothetical protein